MDEFIVSVEKMSELNKGLNQTEKSCSCVFTESQSQVLLCWRIRKCGVPESWKTSQTLCSQDINWIIDYVVKY